MIDITTTQTGYSNSWVGGEAGSINWVSNLNGSAEKQLHSKFNFKSTLKLSFGQTTTQDAETKDWSRPKKSTDLIDFENVGEILAFLNKRSNRACLEGVERKDAVLKKLLSIHQDETVLISLEPFFLVSFKPALLKLFGHYFEDDPPEGEDLGQVIFTSFLEAINNRLLVWREKNIAFSMKI